MTTEQVAFIRALRDCAILRASAGHKILYGLWVDCLVEARRVPDQPGLRDYYLSEQGVARAKQVLA